MRFYVGCVPPRLHFDGDDPLAQSALWPEPGHCSCSTSGLQQLLRRLQAMSA